MIIGVRSNGIWERNGKAGGGGVCVIFQTKGTAMFKRIERVHVDLWNTFLMFHHLEGKRIPVQEAGRSESFFCL